jgi:hypothetical protein
MRLEHSRDYKGFASASSIRRLPNMVRFVKTAGDGMLLEFGSADAALRYAIDVQRAMSADNQSKAPHECIEFRIGMNLGDIIVDGTDIAGDGVNVAARLEALAEQGGICVSAAVREQVHGCLDEGFSDIGEQRVKNIMRAFRGLSGDARWRRDPSAESRSLAVASQASSTLVGRWRGAGIRRNRRGLASAESCMLASRVDADRDVSPSLHAPAAPIISPTFNFKERQRCR